MTEEALLRALEEAKAKAGAGSVGLRVVEITAATGMGERRVRELLRKGIESGVVGRGLKSIERLDGPVTLVPVYYARKKV